MMRWMSRPLHQVDVFAGEPYAGNPVAVVLDATGISTEEMQRFARWTNLSETTFVAPPSDPGADYAVRIFTPTEELPFAGHPTLGSCHAWLETAGADHEGESVVQECGVGLVEIRRTPSGLAFAAPPPLRFGPVEPELVERLAAILGIERGAIVDAHHVDNGPGWVAVLLEDAQAVLDVRPGPIGNLDIGLVGPHPPGAEAAFEVRAFFDIDGMPVEDPVTGSLNASLAQWLTETGRVSVPYVASQGTAIGRAGRVHVTAAADRLWVGGATVTCITGTVAL